MRHSAAPGRKLKEAAKRARCSRSLLSRIENDKTRPSLAMLHRIVEALGTNISALVDAQGDGKGIAVRAGRRPITATDVRFPRRHPVRVPGTAGTAVCAGRASTPPRRAAARRKASGVTPVAIASHRGPRRGSTSS
ncbi:MAG: helix-turn-helix transcriptional regulator [Gammaproteobacteria bacterium]|nr:helix-turn-helix transcriptional regulator [Gammaproteobacteria bacterium]NIR85601.1 helix-turn-helix transcriptional regulator [Gammaproteobacteria bacterium]NIR90042.1 helix-turn-helix transcriptional regulator [Gammaproteobacteria bacterium]NIU06730.1 helix-turn-helix transcriptional regulator [Gammaproteobacteria bacterium]NIV53661.1 helix-turn-helix domain-containing protein [Gammaproteobacteria bacterium]